MTITQVPSTNDKLVIVGEILAFPPDLLFEYWTKPDRIVKWWPTDAEIEPKLGGAYHLSWPQMNWHLRGHYMVFEPGKALTFTWRWDHDLDNSAGSEVTVTFELLPNGGTRMTIIQSPYSDSAEDQEMRIEHHLAGWEHFIRKLQTLTNVTNSP